MKKTTAIRYAVAEDMTGLFCKKYFRKGFFSVGDGVNTPDRRMETSLLGRFATFLYAWLIGYQAIYPSLCLAAKLQNQGPNQDFRRAGIGW